MVLSVSVFGFIVSQRVEYSKVHRKRTHTGGLPTLPAGRYPGGGMACTGRAAKRGYTHTLRWHRQWEGLVIPVAHDAALPCSSRARSLPHEHAPSEPPSLPTCVCENPRSPTKR